MTCAETVLYDPLVDWAKGGGGRGPEKSEKEGVRGWMCGCTGWGTGEVGEGGGAWVDVWMCGCMVGGEKSEEEGVRGWMCGCVGVWGGEKSEEEGVRGWMCGCTGREVGEGGAAWIVCGCVWHECTTEE